jgi:hypothetical protein
LFDAQTGETPYIQRHHFGAVIAPRIANIAHAVCDLGWFSKYRLSLELNLAINRFAFQ